MITCDLRFEQRGEKVDNYKFNQPQKSDLFFLKKEINPDLEYREIVEFRKYLFQYIKGIPNAREWKQKAIPVKTFGEMMKILEELRKLGNQNLCIVQETMKIFIDEAGRGPLA